MADWSKVRESLERCCSSHRRFGLPPVIGSKGARIAAAWLFSATPAGTETANASPLVTADAPASCTWVSMDIGRPPDIDMFCLGGRVYPPTIQILGATPCLDRRRR